MDEFIAVIKIFGFGFAPQGWALCNGALLPINQNQALYALIGTSYGGNGQTNFGLPNLQGRVPIGQGQSPGTSSYVMGQVGGTENVTLLSTNLPAHLHTAQTMTSTQQGAIIAGDATTPENNYLALSPKIGSGPNATQLKTYATPTAATAEANKIKPMVGGTVSGNTSVAGGSIPVQILQPFLAINYSICLYGIFPSRN